MINYGQQWATKGNKWERMGTNGQEWVTMDNDGQQSAVLHASLMPFFMQ